MFPCTVNLRFLDLSELHRPYGTFCLSNKIYVSKSTTYTDLGLILCQSALNSDIASFSGSTYDSTYLSHSRVKTFIVSSVSLSCSSRTYSSSVASMSASDIVPGNLYSSSFTSNSSRIALFAFNSFLNSFQLILFQNKRLLYHLTVCEFQKNHNPNQAF